MNERNKGKAPAPLVQVIRRGPAPGSPAPTAVVPKPVPKPVAPTGVTPVKVSPAPVTPTAAPGAAPASPVAPVSPTTVGAPAGPPRAPRTSSSGPRSFGARPQTPRPPPTPEAIAALAKAERVPARIAKGDLEGKMRCRIWKKLHREEAQRFDQAYALMEQHPTLELADAFGIVQSGLPVPEFLERRQRAKKKEEVKTARSSVAGETIDAFVKELITQAAEVSVVLGDKTVLDTISNVLPVAFELTRSGRLEKLQVVVLGRRTTWEAAQASVQRDAKLAQKPAAVARQPARRPVSDPRPMLDLVGKPVHLQLRNGLKLSLPLIAVGPFDVLVGTPGDELFVPLHAMMAWSAEAPA